MAGDSGVEWDWRYGRFYGVIEGVYLSIGFFLGLFLGFEGRFKGQLCEVVGFSGLYRGFSG